MSALSSTWNRSSRAAAGPAAIFAGRCAYAGSQFAILVAVGRWCGTEAVGGVVLGLAVAVPLFALAGGQLRLLQAIDGEGRFSFASIERAGLLGNLVALALFGAISLAFRLEPEPLAILLGVGFARGVESWSEVAYGRLQRRGALTAIGLSTAFKSLAGLALTIGTLAATGSVGLAYAAGGAAGLLISVGIDRRLASAANEATSAASAPLRILLASALPLSAGAALATFDTQIPRYFVEAFLGPTALGSFGAAHYAALALLTFVIPLTYAWTPALADDVAARDRRAFERRTRRGLMLAAVPGVLAALFALPGAQLLAVAFDDPAIARGWTFPLAIVATAVLAPAAILESALRAAQGLRVLFLVQALSLVLHVALCFEGLRLFGMEGVAAGMLARSVVYAALLAIGLRVAKREAFARADRHCRRLDAAVEDASHDERVAA